MDPDVMLILSLAVIFLVFGIYSAISFYRKIYLVTGRLVIGLIVLLAASLVLFSLGYSFFYASLKDVTLVVYHVILLIGFPMAINIAYFISKQAAPSKKQPEMSGLFCWMSIIFSIGITLLFYYAVGFIDAVNLMGNGS